MSRGFYNAIIVGFLLGIVLSEIGFNWGDIEFWLLTLVINSINIFIYRVLPKDDE